jgi:hypothetical protein
VLVTAWPAVVRQWKLMIVQGLLVLQEWKQALRV